MMGLGLLLVAVGVVAAAAVAALWLLDGAADALDDDWDEPRERAGEGPW